jgi:hypothetical protein
VRSSAPIALRYSASIRAWAHTKLIRQIVLTVTGTELKSSNAASFVMPAAANQRQAPSSRSLGAVHDGHEIIRMYPKGTGPNRTYDALDPMPARAGLAIAQTLIASGCEAFVLDKVAAQRGGS